MICIKFRRLLHILSAAALCLALTGCSAGLAAENMMKPPRADGDGGEIQQAMNDSLEDQISMRFPMSGEMRSAVVRADIDADGEEEAVAFYRLSAESSGAHMIVLDRDERSGWQAVGEGGGSGGEIDRVLFGDVNGDGVTDIITGWTFYSGTSCFISVYTYDGDELREIPVYQTSESGEQVQAIYTEMVAGDFDGDGTDELMTVYLSKQPQRAVVNMLEYRSGGPDGECVLPSCSGELDGSVEQYLDAQAANITGNIYGMVLDGYIAEGICCTEIVYWDGSDNTLATPLNDPSDRTALFTRPQKSTSVDIDGDGVIELPRDELLPGYSQNDESALYLTSWSRYTPGGSAQEMTAMLMRPEQNCAVVFGESWRGRVTVRVDEKIDAGRVLYFHEVTPDEGFGREIMRIRVFSPSEWRQESIWEPSDQIETGHPQYRELYKEESYIYAVLVSSPFTDKEQYPQYSLDMIKESFKILY